MTTPSSEGGRPARAGASGSRADAIAAFLNEHAACDDADLLADLMVTICRLARDRCGRGELKILTRAVKELRYAFKVFAPYHDIRKVSIFGSSRTHEDAPEYLQAVNFARRMCEEQWMVITGAGDGIMRAGHGGAGREASFGVAIRLPFEQKTNEFIADDGKLINFRYFFTRKLLFMKEASAVALFPGGFGTQDEGFEVLTLVQTGRGQMFPVVLIDAPGGTYWQHWRTYVKAELLSAGMISPEDMDLFFLTDDVEAAVREITNFYRVYHSSRYVRDELVLRLKRRLDDETVERLNDEFGGIVRKGRIRQLERPFADEAGEYPHLPRLALRFDRYSIGRLRRMIDIINKVECSET